MYFPKIHFTFCKGQWEIVEWTLNKIKVKKWVLWCKREDCRIKKFNFYDQDGVRTRRKCLEGNFVLLLLVPCKNKKRFLDFLHCCTFMLLAFFRSLKLWFSFLQLLLVILYESINYAILCCIAAFMLEFPISL